ncbi:MAG: hypothetical protein QXW92_00400 [Candidatus Hadarchaeales archaeon]
MLSDFYLPVLDPFGEEAKKIVAKAPPLDSMPQEIIELAVDRLKWKTSECIVEPNERAVENEILSFYLTMQATASVSMPYSREVQFVAEKTRDTIRYRLYNLFRKGEGDFCLKAISGQIKNLTLQELSKALGMNFDENDLRRIRDLRLKKDGLKEVDDHLLPQYMPSLAVRWHDLSPLIAHGRLQVTDLHMVSGWAIVSLRDLWDLYSELMYVKTERYIQEVFEKLQEGGEPHPLLLTVGERISKMVPRAPAIAVDTRRMAGKLLPDCFPPCVSAVMNGVSHGLRNFGVVMLLTSFLSYARIAPSGKASNKISDFVKDISIVTQEIVPLIVEAANRCNPPLFQDQPQEKANIFYHLGFGMTTEPKIEDSGRSKWYMVPNCSKIRSSAPLLCKPDDMCKNVKNPLTYYFLKKREKFRGGVRDNERGKTGGEA